LNKAENKPGGDDADQAGNSHSELAVGGGKLFGVTSGGEIGKTAGNKHKKKSQAGKKDNNLEDIVKKAFEALDSGNVAIGDTAFTRGGGESIPVGGHSLLYKQNAPAESRSVKASLKEKSEGGDGQAVGEDTDTKDGFDELHDSPGSENDGQTNKGVGDLSAGGTNFLFIAFGSDPFETTHNKNEKEDQGDNKHDQADKAGDDTTGG